MDQFKRLVLSGRFKYIINPEGVRFRLYSIYDITFVNNPEWTSLSIKGQKVATVTQDYTFVEEDKTLRICG